MSWEFYIDSVIIKYIAKSMKYSWNSHWLAGFKSITLKETVYLLVWMGAHVNTFRDEWWHSGGPRATGRDPLCALASALFSHLVLAFKAAG